MEWESMSAQQWEEMTEEEWEEMARAEKEREAEKDREALEEEAAAGEAVADAEMEDAEAEPEMQEEVPPPPPVEIWNLRAGQAFAAKTAGAGAFRLRAVAVNNASALEAVLVRQIAEKGWVIVDGALPNLAALSRVDLLLTLGIEAHLPILFANLYTVEYLEACRDWTWDLQTAATEFGGNFSGGKTIKSTCQLLRKIIAGGFNNRRAEDWLVDKLNSALADLKALKVTTAFFA